MPNRLIAVKLLEWTPFWVRLHKGTTVAFQTLAAGSLGELFIVPDTAAQTQRRSFPLRRYLGASAIQSITLAVTATSAINTVWRLLAPVSSRPNAISTLVGVTIALLFLPLFQYSLLRTQLRIMVPSFEERVELLRQCAGIARPKLLGHICAALASLCALGFIWVAVAPPSPMRIHGTLGSLEQDGYLMRTSLGCPSGPERRIRLSVASKALVVASGATLTLSMPNQSIFVLATPSSWSARFQKVPLHMPDGSEVFREYPIELSFIVSGESTVPSVELIVPSYGDSHDDQVEHELEAVSFAIQVTYT